MRQWALERWSESTVVDLQADLTSLKDDVRETMKAEEVALED